jgi:hypothetical protein
MYWRRERRVVKAKPPPTITIFFPSRYSIGQEFPKVPDPHPRPNLHLVKGGGHDACLLHSELHISGIGGRRGDPDRGFPLAEDRQFSELTGIYLNFSSSSLLMKAKRNVLMSLVSTSVTTLISSTG